MGAELSIDCTGTFIPLRTTKPEAVREFPLDRSPELFHFLIGKAQQGIVVSFHLLVALDHLARSPVNGILSSTALSPVRSPSTSALGKE